MARTISFAPGEWYHCYSRGVDKRVIFLEPNEYERFQMQLYAANSVVPIQVSTLTKNIQGPTLDIVLEHPRLDTLVDLGAYALMPNHYHLLIRERYEGGLTSFMRRLNTGYTMYFNKRHDRTGALFSGKFKASHVADQEYFRRVVHYIHGNPAELLEKEWKLGRVSDREALSRFLKTYPYSSLGEYENTDWPKITDTGSITEMLDDLPTTQTTIQDAQDFGLERELVEVY